MAATASAAHCQLRHKNVSKYQRQRTEYLASKDHGLASQKPSNVRDEYVECQDEILEIEESIVHTVTPKKVREWLNRGARSPREAVVKERVREMLS